MKQIIFSLLVLCLSLSACSSVSSLSDRVPQSPVTFEQHLAKGYADFARKEKAQGDWMDAEFFAEKGMKALEGQAVLPESIKKWPISDPEANKQLAWAGSRLHTLLKSDIKHKHPGQMAQAQVLYDCWIEQVAGDDQKQADLNRCRLDFLMAVSALENQKFLQKVQPAAVPRAVKVLQKDAHYTVYFAFARADLDTKAVQVVESVMQSLDGRGDAYVLELSGHTDTAGPKAFNKKLSQARSNAVAKAFLQRGVKKDKIYQRFYGEESLAVKTPDSTPNAKNRRVVIDLSSRP